MNNKFILTCTLIAFSFSVSAQQASKTFSITGNGNNDFIWMNIRQVDLSTGQVIKTIFDRNTPVFSIIDVNTKKTITQDAFINKDILTAPDYPTNTFVAAAAYDKRSNRLFFTPMKIGELRWIDLNVKNTAPQFYVLQSDILKSGNPTDEANSISRMVIGADGNGYALSNDGNHFYKFTTGRTPVITELGNLIDADKNAGNSIHNKCSSWGGDMIADAFGKLYVISANHNVYVVDIKSRIATFKGNIQGLPGGYTTNAAAVNDQGEIVVSSATQFQGYYKLNINDLKAIKLDGSDVKYNASDFANSNLLLQKEADAASMLSTGSGSLPEIVAINDTKVFPNPVTHYTFNVLLDNRPEGKYTIIVSDLAGRPMTTTVVENIAKGNQSNAKVTLSPSIAKGVYLVKVIDQHHAVIINEKIIVQ